MNLHDELDRLARQAPPGANPDPLVHRARRIRSRRAVAIPAAAVLAVLAIMIPAWRWTRVAGPAVIDRPVTLTFRATSPTSPQLLEQTRAVLERRANALGLGHPRATIRDERTIELATSGSPGPAALAALSVPGRFEVRIVLKSTTDVTATPAPAQTPSPSASASTLDGVIAKLGEAYGAALSIPRPGAIDYARVEAFRWLTSGEVALLPASIQLNVPSISCAQLDGRPAVSQLPANAQITVCASSHKLLLGPRAVDGSGVAEARLAPVSDHYGVLITFTGAAGPKWTNMTAQAAAGQGCETADGPHCQAAFMIDGRAVTVPEILSPFTGSVLITTDGAEQSARALAAQIGPLQLPVDLALVG